MTLGLCGKKWVTLNSSPQRRQGTKESQRILILMVLVAHQAAEACVISKFAKTQRGAASPPPGKSVCISRCKLGVVRWERRMCVARVEEGSRGEGRHVCNSASYFLLRYFHGILPHTTQHTCIAQDDVFVGSETETPNKPGGKGREHRTL